MTNDHFKIYVEQLREGQVEEIEEVFASDFIGVSEKDLRFNVPVEVSGEAYLADDMLVLHLDIETTAIMPCLVCNDPFDVQIKISGFYHAVPLKEITTGVYNFSEILRETILLETPPLVECHQGKCPQRKTLEKYFKKENVLGVAEPEDEGYRPFAGLEFDPKDK